MSQGSPACCPETLPIENPTSNAQLSVHPDDRKLRGILNSPLLQGLSYKASILDAESKQDPSLSSLVVEGDSGPEDTVPMAWGGDQQERVSPGRMGRQDSHRYSTHSRTMCRMLSCHRTEAAQLQMPTDSMHLFCIKAQSIASNHRRNHKTDWQPCPSGSMTKNPKLFLLFVDRVSGSPSQPQAHCVVKDLLQFLFLHLPSAGVMMRQQV